MYKVILYMKLIFLHNYFSNYSLLEKMFQTKIEKNYAIYNMHYIYLFKKATVFFTPINLSFYSVHKNIKV